MIKIMFIRKKQRNLGSLIYALRDTNIYQHKGLVRKFKGKIPCMDCNKTYPHQVMSFDHRKREEKICNVSDLVGYKREKLIEEIKKCDLLCSNCHMMRELKRDSEPAPLEYIRKKLSMLAPSLH